MRIVVTDVSGKLVCADVDSSAVVIELPQSTRVRIAGMSAGKEDIVVQLNNATTVQVIC